MTMGPTSATGNLDAVIPHFTNLYGVRQLHELFNTPSANTLPSLFSHLVLQGFKDRVVFIDPGYRVLWANPASAGPGVVGKLCYEAFRGRREPCSMCPVARLFSSGQSTVAEKWMPRPNGSGQWFEVRTYPVSDKRGRIVCAFAICFDVTHRRHSLERREQYIETLERMVKQVERKSPQTHSQPDESAELRQPLTRREMEVLRLMTEGFTNSEIAQRLSVSAHTVKSHVTHIFSKLDVSDRTQAAVQAVRLKLI
jgi:DNA-binding CsgD family transcriptional regulator